jgi:hypothetical protein
MNEGLAREGIEPPTRGFSVQFGPDYNGSELSLSLCTWPTP